MTTDAMFLELVDTLKREHDLADSDFYDIKKHLCDCNRSWCKIVIDPVERAEKSRLIR